MKEDFKKAVATILEAINTVRWELDAVKRAMRRPSMEYQTYTVQRIAGPILDEWVPRELQERKQREVVTERMALDLVNLLLSWGAIEITAETTAAEPEHSPLRLIPGTKYTATIRVVVPRKEEAQP